MTPKPTGANTRLLGLTIRDDVAYLLPMFTFLLLTGVGSKWPRLYPASYVLKTFLTAILLIWLRPAFTRIRWNGWWLGVILGVAGIFQWVIMQAWLERHFAIFRADASGVFNPLSAFTSPATRWGFISVRLIDATLVVPVMEELFWRDYLWRTLLAPSDFKLASVGEWSWLPLLVVPIAFASVHGNWALTAIVWGLMIGGLLAYTRSLGACIVMHAVTNLLLAIYVLRYHEWSLW